MFLGKSVCCIFFEHLFLRTSMEGCFWKLNKIVSKLFYHLENVTLHSSALPSLAAIGVVETQIKVFFVCHVTTKSKRHVTLNVGSPHRKLLLCPVLWSLVLQKCRYKVLCLTCDHVIKMSCNLVCGSFDRKLPLSQLWWP